MLSFHAKKKKNTLKLASSEAVHHVGFKKCTFIICGTLSKTNLEFISDYG